MKNPRIRVAMLATDTRECYREYEKTEPYFGAAPEALFAAVPNFPEIEMHIISCWQKPMSAPAKLAENIWFHGLPVSKLGWGRTGFHGCIRATRRKIRELKPDIVHGQGTERDCAISAAFSGYPNVVTIHGNMNALAELRGARLGSYFWVMARLENLTLRRTGGVFCNSEYTERLVRPRTKRTWRVPNSIRREFFTAEGANRRSEKCVLVNVGVISQRKRQLEILRIVRELHREVKFEVWFVGKAEPSGYTEQFLDEMRHAEKSGYARFLGMQSAEDLVRTFDTAHGMIHFPSEEAFGLVVAEGLARNLKFFGSRVGGIVDIANALDGVELIGAGDWDALGDALRSWIRKGFPRPQRVAQTVAERYHPNVVMKQHLAIYEEVLRTERAQHV